MGQAQQKNTLEICVIEQNPLAAKYLIQVLQKDAAVRVGTLEDLAKGRSTHRTPLVFLLDTCGMTTPIMPVLRMLSVKFPAARCLVLGQGQPGPEMMRLLWQGIHGHLTHEEVDHALLPALHAVAEGRMWFPREALRSYVEYTSAAYGNRARARETMTPRENEILELAKRRLSNKEIGEILKIRESTVKFHLSNIFSKLGVTNRRDLVEKENIRAPWGQLLVCAESGAR